MWILGTIMLILLLGIVPLYVGALPNRFVDKEDRGLGFMWMAGFVLLWMVFQFVAVPLILLEQVGEEHFPYVVICFGVVSFLLALLGFWKGEWRSALKKGENLERNNADKILWCIALVLIVLQLLASVLLVYADGDDAYYVAVSTITESSDTMYKIAPYSIGLQELDERHSLAPFPIWIAYLSRMSGLSVAFTAHVAVSTVLIALAYVVYFLIGKLLFGKKRELIPVFLSGVALLNLFGDYSSHTVENFMLARSRQGKAALGSLIIPICFYLMLLIFQHIQKGEKTKWIHWLLLLATVTGGCLCTTLGTFLVCVLLAVFGICGACVYHKWECLWKTACCCVPAVIFALLYVVIG